MSIQDPIARMWIDACELLSHAERLHRHSFQILRESRDYPGWEPPVDVFDIDRELKIVALLPGVTAERLNMSLEDQWLTIAADSPFPIDEQANILRLEIPYGRFEKRLRLPSPDYELVASELKDGCLTLRLRRTR